MTGSGSSAAKKDVIIRGGHSLDPGPVEDVLSCHPAVQVAAVGGDPCALKGELPLAYVQLRPGSRVEVDELLALCQREVPERAAVPIDVVVIGAMPVTAVGKIFKPVSSVYLARSATTTTTRLSQRRSACTSPTASRTSKASRAPKASRTARSG